MEESPLEVVQRKLLAHVSAQAAALPVAKKAAIMGVSTPTYNKRLREMSLTHGAPGSGEES